MCLTEMPSHMALAGLALSTHVLHPVLGVALLLLVPVGQLLLSLSQDAALRRRFSSSLAAANA